MIYTPALFRCDSSLFDDETLVDNDDDTASTLAQSFAARKDEFLTNTVYQNVVTQTRQLRSIAVKIIQ